MSNFAVERLDHLGIVAGVCQEMGLVEYFNRLDEQVHARVSLGQAVLAMVLNGLGFSNRRLYLVPQFFQHKPIDRLIGPGITAEDLNDDCLGRALDWLTAHDLTALFAGLAHQARRRFGVQAEAVHVDSTSFAVEGTYERKSWKPMRRSFALPTATRATIVPISSNGTFPWQRRPAACPLGCNCWMGTHVTAQLWCSRLRRWCINFAPRTKLNRSMSPTARSTARPRWPA